MTKYYLAYGSNLNISEMKKRCPLSTPIGPAMLPNYRLVFKGDGIKGFLTIEPCEGIEVPVGVYQITNFDEKYLDFYEGVPTLYNKKTITLNVRGEEIEAIIYIMNQKYTYTIPSENYVSRCLKGYQDFKLNTKYLEDALTITKGNISKKTVK